VVLRKEGSPGAVGKLNGPSTAGVRDSTARTHRFHHHHGHTFTPGAGEYEHVMRGIHRRHLFVMDSAEERDVSRQSQLFHPSVNAVHIGVGDDRPAGCDREVHSLANVRGYQSEGLDNRVQAAIRTDVTRIQHA
jgi:hypothetical protein